MPSPKSTRRDLLSRRSFVKASLATAGALAGGPTVGSLLAADSVAPSDQLSAAIIGAGGIARFHAAHQLAPYLRIRGVCDVDEARAQTYNREFAKGEATVCHDYRQLLEREDIDVVVVCTPDHWHAKIAVDALRSGKDVYCEKPLTLTVAEGQLIRTVVAETEQILQVGTQQRSDVKFQTAVALAHSGRLGAVKRITVAIGGAPAGGPFASSEPPAGLDWDRWLGQAPATEFIPERCHGNFRWWYEYSGGKMTDWGAHHVDIAHWAIDPNRDQTVVIDPLEVQHPVSFEEGMPKVGHSYNTANSFRVSCQYSDGAELVIRDQAEDLGFDNGLLVECEDGRFFVNRGKLTGKPVQHLEDAPLDADMLQSLRKGRKAMSHMAGFYHSCHDRTEPISDVASHMSALNICHLANVAMRLNRPIRWDPKSETTDTELMPWLSRMQREGYEVV